MTLQIWTEKYRPKLLSEIKGQENIISRLQSFVKEKNMPHLLFAGSAGVGKCVSADTPVILSSGEIINISDAYKQNKTNILSLSRDGQIIPAESKFLYKSTAKRLVKIKTTSGAQVKVTPEHKFLILQQGIPVWIEATALKVGDRCATPNKLLVSEIEPELLWPEQLKPIKGKVTYINKYGIKSSTINYFQTISEPFAEWLGLLVGDSNIRRSSIRFYNKKSKLLDKFKSITENLFGISLEWKLLERKGVPYWEIRKARTLTLLVENILKIKPDIKKADIVSIPKEILLSSNKILAAFIRGYYECDGSFYKNRIEFCSVSRKLIYELKISLLRFGIISRLKQKEKSFNLYVSGSDNLKKFAFYIKPSIKQIHFVDKGVTNVDTISVNVPLIRKILQNFGIHYATLVQNKKEFEYILTRGIGSRTKVQKILKQICELCRIKIDKALESLHTLESSNLDFDLDLGLLSEYKIRKDVQAFSDIRYDRLKEYAIGRRIPTLRNTLKLLKALSLLKQVGAQESYNQILEILKFRKLILELMQTFCISYAELSEQIRESPANLSFYLNNNSVSLKAIKNIKVITLSLKQLIEERILNYEIIEKLELMDFLANAQVFWDEIREISELPGGEVYDLNVLESHNFIGGDGLFVLHNTTTALAIARELYGDNWKDNILETNASDERGIDTIRHKVKDFARTKSISGVPKIIFLDEADSLTQEAQHALRRTMEDYVSATRFILNANYSSKIIPAIQSRCAVFRFKPLTKSIAIEHLKSIVQNEGLTSDVQSLEFIYEVSEGDMRKAENILQACASIEKNITLKVVNQVVSFAEPQAILEVLKLSLSGQFLKAKNLLTDIIIEHGLSGLDAIKQIQAQIWNLGVSERQKVELIKSCGEYEFRVVEGSNEFIQLNAMLAAFTLIKNDG